MIFLNEYVTASGEIILYNGNPNFEKLEDLSNGVGDIWHSSFEQGFKNAFPEIVYQTATFFWYVKDLDNLDLCMSWRINPFAFAVRKSVWETLNGFDKEYENPIIQAFDFGFNTVRNYGGVVLYAKGLYENEDIQKIAITRRDRYAFYIKNFKKDHAIFMIYRKGVFNILEWKAYLFAKKKFKQRSETLIVKPRKLKPIKGNSTVSYIIPTMMRQDFTFQLLEDLQNQTYKPTQVVVVDATPENLRDEKRYNKNKYDFELIIKWQTTKGSCRARNEAIDLCTSEYIVFGDDDIRIPSNYIENHISFLQTYNADACNGLDIRADHQKQTLDDLKIKLDNYGKKRFLCGAAPHINNANNCVKRKYVQLVDGNDINFDGGYGEDKDFGLSLTKIGVVVLQNPFSTNLHLKPAVGGYRFWGSESKILGKKRKVQPWELDTPVKWIRPVPSPTIMYYFYKHFGSELTNEYKHKYFFIQLFKGSFFKKIISFMKFPYKLIQFEKSLFYAKKLNSIGKRSK
jgi:glycosyltransferase involved in cell wall biosynthesis